MCDMRHPVSIASPLWQWLRKKFTLIYTWLIFSSSYSIFFYYHLKNINQSIRKKKTKKTRKKPRYAVSRYAVTSLPVTPLRVLLTTFVERFSQSVGSTRSA